MAEQKATDIRRILADVENNAKDLRDRQGILENQLLSAIRRGAELRPTPIIEIWLQPSCCVGWRLTYRKSNASILVMQSTQDRTAQNASCCLGGT